MTCDGGEVSPGGGPRIGRGFEREIVGSRVSSAIFSCGVVLCVC